jgi:hypothetical protein
VFRAPPSDAYLDALAPGEEPPPSIVVKLIPMEGDVEVNGAPQKGAGDLMAEAVIALTLSGLRAGEGADGAALWDAAGTREREEHAGGPTHDRSTGCGRHARPDAPCPAAPSSPARRAAAQRDVRVRAHLPRRRVPRQVLQGAGQGLEGVGQGARLGCARVDGVGVTPGGAAGRCDRR